MKQTHTCRLCKVELPIDSFTQIAYKSTTRPYAYCKPCHTINQRKYRKLDRYKAYEKGRRHKAQRLVYKVLCRSSCALCGEKDILTLQFDHIDPKGKNGKEYEIGKLVHRKGTGIDTVKAEIRKCRVLCANCHQRHTFIQQGSWRVQMQREQS